jgi:hypothetical protein
MNKYIIPYYYLNAAWGVAMIGLVRFCSFCHVVSFISLVTGAEKNSMQNSLALARCFYIGVINFKTLGAKVSRIQRARMAEFTDLVSEIDLGWSLRQPKRTTHISFLTFFR